MRAADLLRRVLTRPGWRGVLAYTLPEAIWLVRSGVTDDVLVAYPSVDRTAIVSAVRDLREDGADDGVITRAPKGSKPGMFIGRSEETTAKIDAIDPENNSNWAQLDDPERRARRLVTAADALGAREVTVVITDPEPPPDCDYVVVESTYGDRAHADEHPKDALERIINAAAAHNGLVSDDDGRAGQTSTGATQARDLVEDITRITGRRSVRNDRFVKRTTSKLYNKVTSIVTGVAAWRRVLAYCSSERRSEEHTSELQSRC